VKNLSGEKEKVRKIHKDKWVPIPQTGDNPIRVKRQIHKRTRKSKKMCGII
jgi:hypothetical protein